MSKAKKEFIRTVKFILFSISAAGVQVVSFSLLNELLELRYWLSYLIALILSTIWSFTLNRKFTFHSANNVPIAMLKLIGFYLVFTPLSTWWTAVLTDKAHWNEYLVLAITMVINLVSEYLYDRIVVFGSSIDTAKKKGDENENI